MHEASLREGRAWLRWTHEIRRIEFERTMEHVSLGRGARVLELGSGDGFQLELLRLRFDRVFAIDPEHRPMGGSRFCFSSAESLPFPDGAFDLVISCCVVEHLRDRRLALQEAVRVLRAGGWMAHVVPAPFWKVASVLANPVGYPLRVAEKWWELRHIRRRERESHAADSERATRPGVWEVLWRWVSPPIHGTYPSHVTEYRAYTPERWRKTFTHPQLAPVAEVPLPTYTQFGFLRFRLLFLREWLAQHGWAGSRGFIMRKVE